MNYYWVFNFFFLIHFYFRSVKFGETQMFDFSFANGQFHCFHLMNASLHLFNFYLTFEPWPLPMTMAIANDQWPWSFFYNLLFHSEPSARGILIAYTNVWGTLGNLFVFVLNTLIPWRMVALVCMFVPIITVVALCFVSISQKNAYFNGDFFFGSFNHFDFGS